MPSARHKKRKCFCTWIYTFWMNEDKWLTLAGGNWTLKNQCLTLTFFFFICLQMSNDSFFSYALLLARNLQCSVMHERIWSWSTNGGDVGRFNLNLWSNQTKTILIDFNADKKKRFAFLITFYTSLELFTPIAYGCVQTIHSNWYKNDTEEF